VIGGEVIIMKITIKDIFMLWILTAIIPIIELARALGRK